MADADQEVHNGPPQSKLVLAKPKLGGFSAGASVGAGSSGNPFTKIGSGSVLRPAQLKPALGANPFLRVSTGNESAGTDSKVRSGEDRLKEQTATETSESPMFVPLGSNRSVHSSNPVPAPAPAGASSSGFVFGQNLSERAVVTGAPNNGAPSLDHSSTNGNTELLFSSAVASKVDKDEGGSSGASGEGLAAAAAEYERSHARPQLLAAAPTTTGEEDETNVLQITCRLFAWESGSWRERGRGMLRLNDQAAASSRLVCRATGSLRVVLNTKLWADMVSERAGARSLRITATDQEQHVKLFLIMAAPTEIAQLHRALTTRIEMCRKTSDSSRSTNTEISQHIPSHPEEVNSDDQFDHDDDLRAKIDEKTSEIMDAKNTDISDQKTNITNNLRPKIDENGAETPEAKNTNISSVNTDVSDENTNITEDSIEDIDIEKEASKTLKRKEVELENGSSSKRQCPEILIE